MTRELQSVERYNIDNCDAAFDGNRFQLILAASVRAHEISKTRTIAARNAGALPKYANQPTVEALLEFENGKVGKEYLNKVTKQR